MFERASERVVRILERASALVRPEPLSPEEYNPELLIRLLRTAREEDVAM